MSAGHDSDVLRRELRGATAWITLNRPDARNALSREMVRELAAVADLLERDQETSVVVVRGANGTFCAGGDIRGFMTMFKSPQPLPGEKDPVALGNREFGTFMTRFEALPQTIVMVVEGAAFGGGLGLMCGGDVVLAAADAKFSISETTLGVPPAQIAPFVAQRIGVSRTRRLSLTAHRFDGREAERIGLVDKVVPADQVYDEAVKWASQFASAATYAVRAAKESIDRGLEVDLDTGLEIERQQFAGLFATQDRSVGMDSFVENGPGKARFEGR
jgi:isohexenylglutaconyl-CoA hydratase